MKEIKFHPLSVIAENSIPSPKPASECAPEWYKNIKPFSGNNKPEIVNGSVINKTVKTCMPFSDALNSGYIQETWCDIKISFKNGNVYYDYSVGPEPISYRKNTSINISKNFMQHELIWKVYWLPQLEPGYSALITHPLNRFDLPFLSTSGVIDSDKFFHTIGNYPFYVYDTEEIFIPSGTPMYQIIPIKRDAWKSVTEEFNEKKSIKKYADAQRFFYATYKKIFHQKKIYR